MKVFILTLRFLTRIPVPYNDNTIITDDEFAKGIIFFPLIGVITGIINAIVFMLAGHIQYGMLSSVCAVLSGIMVTGAFHIDGLADTCDGIFSSRNRNKMIEIMGDSRVGTNGAVAIMFDILFKIIIINGLEMSNSALWYIILAPVAGKMITPILADSVYAKEEKGLGNIYIGRLKSNLAIGAVFIGTLIIMLVLGLYGILPVVITIITAYLFRVYIERKIGGMTGDTLGAGAEIAEVVFLAVCAFMNY